MTDYRVKNFSCKNGKLLQKAVKEWIESRKHVTIIHMNTWCDNAMSYCTITYTENTYEL
ncbi:MAG: hypothetical protein ACRCX2_19500 [Paraclostridium sp.]